jgi:hypothetical protein
MELLKKAMDRDINSLSNQISIKRACKSRNSKTQKYIKILLECVKVTCNLRTHKYIKIGQNFFF